MNNLDSGSCPGPVPGFTGVTTFYETVIKKMPLNPPNPPLSKGGEGGFSKFADIGRVMRICKDSPPTRSRPRDSRFLFYPENLRKSASDYS